MEFGFSKELDLLREMYKKFAETEIKPLAENWMKKKDSLWKAFPNWLDTVLWVFLSLKNTAVQAVTT